MIKSIRRILETQRVDRLFWALLLLWIACDVVEAVYMEVMSDEAYYALYGQHLAWGYYDHPPMVAISNFLSSCLFSGNLGVRFVNVLTHALTVWVTWKMLDDRKTVSNVLLYFAISFSFLMYSAYGFITTPDGLLLLFTALFLFFYKKFLEEESWANTIYLTLAVAGMFYSKYHAVLIVGFVVLSNLRLFLKPKFWFCVCAAILLYIPHIYWQIDNNFPSFRYHLIGRNQGIDIAYILKYFPEQFVVFSPVAMVGVICILIKKKAENLFERALYFLIIGIFLFFQFMAFKGRVEPHWTVAASIPMILLLYKWSLRDVKFGKIQFKGALWMIGLVIIARVVLAMDVLPQSFAFNGKERGYSAINKVAGNLPVVFPDASFQEGALYRHFTGGVAFPLSSPYTRTTQFDIWGFDKMYQDSTVFVCMEEQNANKYNVNGFEFSGFVVNRLQTTNQIHITYSDVPKTVHVGDTLRLKYTLFNPYRKDIDMNHSELPVAFCSVYIGPNDLIAISPAQSVPDYRVLKAGEYLEGELTTVIPSVEPSSDYLFGLSLKNRLVVPFNSSFVKIQILIR